MQINNVSNTTQVVNQSSKVANTKKTSSTSFDSYMNKDKEVSLEDIFEKAADKYNVSIDLLKAIAKQESNFNPDATSRSGAMGVMQLMPATAKGLGVTDAYDAEQNIMGGAKLISSLINQYDGDTKLALAAYNAGSGNVRKYGGIPPFKETQNYVVKVMQYYKQNLDASDITVTSKETSNITANATTSAPTTSVINVSNSSDDVVINKSISTVEELSDKLDEIFSMNDYLKMVEIMFGSDEDSEQKDSINQSYNQLGMSTPIINMLKNI